MSTKSSLFLTSENEHWYEETNEPHHNALGEFIGYTIVMEFDKTNTKIVMDDNQDIMLEITPSTELYELIKKMKQ